VGDFQHPVNSPELASSDYYLFLVLKQFLREKRFTNDEKLQESMKTFFWDKSTQSYATSMNKLIT